MKNFLLAGLFFSFAGCKPSFNSLTKEQKFETVRANVISYCDAKMSKKDLAVKNYLMAYSREVVGVKNDTLTPYSNIRFMNAKGDSVEVSLPLANSSRGYKTNAQGHKAYSTGLHFAIDHEGQVKSHEGYILYFGDNEKYTPLKGDDANLLYLSSVE